MQDSPLPLIETILFIGFVVWLFLWQQKPRSDDRTERRDEQPDRDQAGRGD